MTDTAGFGVVIIADRRFLTGINKIANEVKYDEYRTTFPNHFHLPYPRHRPERNNAKYYFSDHIAFPLRKTDFNRGSVLRSFREHNERLERRVI